MRYSGNLTSTTLPNGEKTETSYNVFRKPIRIVQADQTEICHFYNKNGTLAKTLHPDGGEIRYTYDIFQRPKSKTHHAPYGDMVSEETWAYTAFQMQEHTDPTGLTTVYCYDGAGRKISETAENRTIKFNYDSLGFLEKTGKWCSFSYPKMQ